MGVNAPLNRKLRMGLIGGGQGSFIGRVHSIAAVLDNRAALVAGALSSDPAKAKASAADYDIRPERAYGSYKEMIEAEKKLPADERIDFVSIATPNHTHFEIAKAFAEAGFNVMCDKPMTFDLAQAEELAKVVQKTGVVFAVTHNYTGYPLVRQAREMVKAGELGEINAVRAFYIQGWLRHAAGARRSEKQAGWRTDPKQSGAAGCFGDIGTHAYNLGRFITGLMPDQISATSRPSSRAASSTTTARPSSATPTAPSAPSRRRRSRMAAKTTCGSRSTARRRRWNGIRRSRTRCSSAPTASRTRSTRATRRPPT